MSKLSADALARVNEATSRMSLFYKLYFRYFKLHSWPNGKTMGVCYNAKTGNLELHIDEEFMNRLSTEQLAEIFKHEILHVVFRHVLVENPKEKRALECHRIAVDLEINQHLDAGIIESAGGCNIGQAGRPWENFPKGMTYDYYERLLNEVLPSGGDGFDSHEGFGPGDAQSEAMTLAVAEEMERLVDKITNRCMQMGGKEAGDGSLMQKLVELGYGITLSKKVPWEKVLQSLLKMTRDVKVVSTYRKINKKLQGALTSIPGATARVPGLRRLPRTKVLVAVDESGSVGDDQWAKLVVALNGISEHASWDVVPFDGACSWENLVSPGSKYKSRQYCGGTCFESVVQTFNEHAKDYAALVILTDGEDGKPESRLRHGAKLIYVICGHAGAGDHLKTSNSTVIYVE